MDNPTPEELEALEIARQLIRGGVPVFAAAPDPDRPGAYKLPREWEKTVPTESWIERWRPGWALAAVGGHTCDFLDVDPRSGGIDSLHEVQTAGHMPAIFGAQKTPSGGRHFVIPPTGEHKSCGFMPGLDLQAGAPDGRGRGFVWIAPTVRPSKDPANLGELVRYTWSEKPDLAALGEQGQFALDSTEMLVARVHASRAARKTPSPATAPPTDPGDPFLTTADLDRRAHADDRSFTLDQAQDFVRPYLLDLQAAPIGQIEERANISAAALSHFVPEFWSADAAMGLLLASLAHTAYDPDGPGEWTADKFVPVLDGRRPPLDPWKATRRPEVASAPLAVIEAVPGEEGLSTLDKLRGRLVSAAELAASPAPRPLVHGLLDLDSEAWLIGAPGSLKSFVALDLAGHVGRGAGWQNHRTRQAPVLYLAAEGSGGMVLRTRAWQEHNGEMTGVTFLPYPVKVKSQDGQWDALVQLARELAPGLVVIDTQARVSVGLEENSATDMGLLVDAVGRLRRATGACVLVIHHTGRNGGDARGSSALDGAQDTELKIVRDEPRTALACRVLQDKQKDMAEGDREGIRLHMRVIDLGVDPHTGRELSSLVVGAADPYADAQVREVSLRQPWLPEFRTTDKWRKCYLDTLYVFAPVDHGMTKAELDRTMKENWPEYDPRNSGPRAAWSDLQDMKDPAGDPIVGKLGGERFGVVSLPVRNKLAEDGIGRDKRFAVPGIPIEPE